MQPKYPLGLTRWVSQLRKMNGRTAGLIACACLSPGRWAPFQGACPWCPCASWGCPTHAPKPVHAFAWAWHCSPPRHLTVAPPRPLPRVAPPAGFSAQAVPITFMLLCLGPPQLPWGSSALSPLTLNHCHFPGPHGCSCPVTGEMPFPSLLFQWGCLGFKYTVLSIPGVNESSSVCIQYK